MEAAGTTLWGWWDHAGQSAQCGERLPVSSLHNRFPPLHGFKEGDVQNDAATIPNYVELTSDVVSAYVSNNSLFAHRLTGSDWHGACCAFRNFNSCSIERKAHAAGANQQDYPPGLHHQP